MPPSTQPAPLPPSSARLSLGNDSPALSTSAHLRFQLDHAQARDAVHTPLDSSLLARGLSERGLNPILLRSAAANRADYLRRPDLGRTLHPDSISHLQSVARNSSAAPNRSVAPNASAIPNNPDFPSEATVLYPLLCLFLLADGLSALALERHALPLLDATLSLIPAPYSVVPVVENSRVAIGDDIGSRLNAALTILLIGERPGLSSPDSLGVYITWDPRPGRTDAERNCISNIRAEGLSYAEAAFRIAHYVREAQRLQATGIALKDPDSPALP
jgi:ethanolamine ammonia-lyase small subunit